MYFESFEAALVMDGHGSFVWSVVLVSALVIAGLLLGPWLVNRRLRAAQRAALERSVQEDHVTRQEGSDAPGA